MNKFVYYTSYVIKPFGLTVGIVEEEQVFQEYAFHSYSDLSWVKRRICVVIMGEIKYY